MLLGFILGVTFGVILMAAVQINYVNKEFESDCRELTQEKHESFTYDCLKNDPWYEDHDAWDDVYDAWVDKHIPKIN